MESRYLCASPMGSQHEAGRGRKGGKTGEFKCGLLDQEVQVPNTVASVAWKELL